jgi:putative SOS response-associated peptidase YedK
MCGRYASYLPPDAIAALFRTVNPLPNAKPTWNLAPTQDALVVRLHPKSGERQLDLLNWGFLPYWTKDPAHARRPINARGESIERSSLFRDSFARRRALIPAADFYEWQPIPGQKQKQPFAVARQDGKSMALAGLWDGWRAPGGEIIRSFAIITTAANKLLAAVHDRMPVVIEEADWPAWLGEIEANPKALLRPSSEDIMRLWPVGNAVNSVRNDGPELLVPDAVPDPTPGHLLPSAPR